MQIADYIQALPDSYQKHSESNNYKLLLLEQKLVQALTDDIEAVDGTLDIYTATGKTLDLYGAIYGQSRGSMTDEQYRYIILQKVTRNLASGDANSVIKALAVTFDVPASQVGLAETENVCEVAATNLPYAVLQKAGFTGKQVQELIFNLLPSGVKLAKLQLDGTFEFSASADEYDAEAGFGNIDQTVGGYFGLLVTDDIDVPV